VHAAAGYQFSHVTEAQTSKMTHRKEINSTLIKIIYQNWTQTIHWNTSFTWDNKNVQKVTSLTQPSPPTHTHTHTHTSFLQRE